MSMSYFTIKSDAYKKPTYALLSAILGLAVTPSVFASSYPTWQETTLKTEAYHCNNPQPQSLHFKKQTAYQRAIKCMLIELQDFQQNNKTARQQYFAYKAQAWLNYAIHKNSMNSPATGLQAVQNAKIILAALKNGTEQGLALIQDIPSNSALMRPDLWATLSAIKKSDGIASAPRELAFSEIALIWAATDHCERGRYDSGVHFRMADRWLEQAREAYVNAHNSRTNVALEELIVHYYKQYAPLDSSDDVCHGQTLTSTS